MHDVVRILPSNAEFCVIRPALPRPQPFLLGYMLTAPAVSSRGGVKEDRARVRGDAGCYRECGKHANLLLFHGIFVIMRDGVS
eukprot:COSAG01_NODE_40255_length_465_cov_135.554645_1_plen_82_part_01